MMFKDFYSGIDFSDNLCFMLLCVLVMLIVLYCKESVDKTIFHISNFTISPMRRTLKFLTNINVNMLITFMFVWLTSWHVEHRSVYPH